MTLADVQRPEADSAVPRTKLPSADAPLVLPDGTHVAPSTAQTFSRIEVPSNSTAQRLVASTRRKLADLPALPKQMNSYAVVLCYTASGLSDAEISVATGFTEQQVRAIRVQPAYASLEALVIGAVKDQAASEVKDILVSGERKAAEKIVKLADSHDERTALAASREILHMGGHKAAEKVDIRTQMMSTFRIEVVDKREVSGPVIDVAAEDG